MSDTTTDSAAMLTLAAEDRRQEELHYLLETIREQIRLEIPVEHRPEGLFTNIQNAVYAMRGRTPLLNDASITSALAAQPAPRVVAQLRELWTAISGHEPRCRDCADSLDGKCRDGRPCDPHKRALHDLSQLQAAPGVGMPGREALARIIHGDDEDFDDLVQASTSHGPRQKYRDQVKSLYAKADAILALLAATPSSGGETFETIAQWCDETFGPALPARIAERASEEMDELVAEPTKIEEAADVVIVLSRYPGLWDAVERKMKINRGRKWRLMGDGSGYHIPAAPGESSPAVMPGSGGGDAVQVDDDMVERGCVAAVWRRLNNAGLSADELDGQTPETAWADVEDGEGKPAHDAVRAEIRDILAAAIGCPSPQPHGGGDDR